MEPLNISATLRTEKNNLCVRKLIRPQRVWDSPQEVRDSPKEVRDSVCTENIPWSPKAKGHFAYDTDNWIFDSNKGIFKICTVSHVSS